MSLASVVCDILKRFLIWIKVSHRQKDTRLRPNRRTQDRSIVSIVAGVGRRIRVTHDVDAIRFPFLPSM